MVVQGGAGGVEGGADGFVPVPDEQQLGHALLSTLGRQARLCVLIPAVLHRLLQGPHRLRDKEKDGERERFTTLEHDWLCTTLRSAFLKL